MLPGLTSAQHFSPHGSVLASRAPPEGRAEGLTLRRHQQVMSGRKEGWMGGWMNG